MQTRTLFGHSTKMMESPVLAAHLGACAETRSAGVQAGASFESIYEAHVDFVWRSALRLGVDEAAADDVVQQVFLVVHRRLADFEEALFAKDVAASRSSSASPATTAARCTARARTWRTSR